MKSTYMLDTNICSFIMRERPTSVLERLQRVAQSRHRIVISAITYAELRFGAIGKKASPKHSVMIDEFVSRIDEVLPWDRPAVDETTRIKKHLGSRGTPIGPNDLAIAGHAVSAQCVLVTNNLKEFARVPNLLVEDWLH